MKTLLFITVFVTLSAVYAFPAEETANFKVYGACGMCKARIEKAAGSFEGISSANWSLEKQILTITYDAAKVNIADVHKKIAESGHDTEKVAAEDEVYKSLPACCHYERAVYDNPCNEHEGAHQKHSTGCKSTACCP